MDIVCVYWATGQGSREQRSTSMQVLANHLQSPDKVLTVMAGDFNYVNSRLDRMCAKHGTFTGEGDHDDEKSFQTILGEAFQLAEWRQEHFTHSNAISRSRIDRVYCNQHVNVQLDRSFGCAALNFDHKLSTHRPISFRRVKGTKNDDWTPPLPVGPVAKKKEWKERIDLCYSAKISSDELCGLATRRLLLLKEAITEVTLRMSDEGQIDVAQEAEDKVGWTMTFIRATEKINLGVMRKCAAAYPKLATICNPADCNLRVRPEFKLVKDHAVELSREAVARELTSLQGNGDQMDAQAKARKTF